MSKKYRKISDQYVVAVQLDLETTGFSYQKWGNVQQCKKGDWVVNNRGDVYTIDQVVFANTYRKVDSGQYVKTTPIWAEKVIEKGTVQTKEGASDYESGDYLVSNNKDGTDAYCIKAKKFESMYEPDD